MRLQYSQSFLAMRTPVANGTVPGCALFAPNIPALPQASNAAPAKAGMSTMKLLYVLAVQISRAYAVDNPRGSPIQNIGRCERVEKNEERDS